MTMFTRRQFLVRTLQGSSLVALHSVVPGFLATTARAATPGKDKILVVIEMTGGNDGLNTVIPYGDDLYYKNRPTLGYKKKELITVDDHIGLHPGLRGLSALQQQGQLAIVQGVGYPNPDRSHFESMDIWQMADPKRKIGTGWLGRTMNSVKVEEGHMPGMYVGNQKLPVALEGSALGTPAIDPAKPYELRLESGDTLRVDQPPTAPDGTVFTAVDTGPAGPQQPKQDDKPSPHREARMKLIKELTEATQGAPGDLLQFVRRSSLQTYTAVESLRRLMKEDLCGSPDPNAQVQFDRRRGQSTLGSDLGLVAKMIKAGFGTRIFYVAIDGFDTHSKQKNDHNNLMQQFGDAVQNFFMQLQQSGHDKRVILMNFSEFGRRVKENGSQGTDHGAGSCLFVAGPQVKGGVCGKHPSLADLDAGDLKHHTDFRRVYATLLDKWLECDSTAVLGAKYEHVDVVKA
jgi:uncharacterized protein (DUF1501 family)